MDGMHDSAAMMFASTTQHTLKAAIGCVGVGMHSGRHVSLTLRPAAPDHGIVFRRTDLGRDLPARFDWVADTRLCTVLTDPADPKISIGTVEHVMAALVGAGIDNAVVEVDGPEVPILDGSASPFLFLIDCAGIAEQNVPSRAIEVLRPVRVTDGDAFAELRPSNFDTAALEMAVSIDFDAAAIGRQALSLTLSTNNFRRELADARTFALAGDIARLREAGLALGGSLDNAVVVDGARVLNPGGLRSGDEFVRHKLLDAVGDLALAGARLRGRFLAHRTGHTLNNRLLRALFADPTAWREVSAAAMPASTMLERVAA
jgi:UDP-3-O-[3-hydroxymyristoyl] N-acetylglucosamine deacetylase